MTTTTTYGSWANYTNDARVEDTVFIYLDEFIGDYDIDGLVAAYRAAINAALPDGIALCGDEFYGPYPHLDRYAVNNAIRSIDLGALAENYDRSAE